MMKRGLVLLMLLLLCAAAYSQDTKPLDPNACLEKELADSTRLILADGGRPKIGFLVEHITWSDDYRKAAADVVQTKFASRLAFAGDDTLGTLVLYISGTPVVSNGAQYVGVRLQVDSDELLLPENGTSILDPNIHAAKLGDPTLVLRGSLVLAEDGILLPPIEQGIPFELWHQLNIQQVRGKVEQVLTEFLAAWDKAGKK